MDVDELRRNLANIPPFDLLSLQMLGIEPVAGVIDGGGNRAWDNGNPLQCLNVDCGCRRRSLVARQLAASAHPSSLNDGWALEVVDPICSHARQLRTLRCRCSRRRRGFAHGAFR